MAKRIDLDAWEPIDTTNPLKSLAHEVDAQLDILEEEIDSLRKEVATKVTQTATTTTTTSGPVKVGGAVNPMYSPVATTTTTKGYIAAYCNAGVMLTLDNLKFGVTTGGQRGLCCATVAGTAVLSISASYALAGGASGNATAWPGATYTTTPSGSWFGWSFPNAGDGSVYLCNDYTNQRVYRVTLQIGPGYSGNFISIERLL